MRTPGSAAELEARRRRAAEYFQERRPLREIATLLGVSLTSVKRWKRTWKAEGVEGLAAKPHPGPAPKLSEEQRESLVEMLYSKDRQRPDIEPICGLVREFPRSLANSFESPTIQTTCGGSCTIWVSRRRSYGVSPASKTPKPSHNGGDRTGRGSKKARRRGASIVFIDDSGFRLQPVNRRTWAPRGETPVQRAWDRYDRLSVIGALTLSPTRCRIGTPFQIYDDNIRTDAVVDFIRQLRKQLRRPLIIGWDRWPVHRSAAKRIAISRLQSIEFEWLPAYAPELNPVESRWSHTKYGDLANFVPDDVTHLKRNIRTSLKKQFTSQQLKSPFSKPPN